MECFYIDNHLLVVLKPQNIKFEEFKEEIKKDLEKKNLKSSFLEELYKLSYETGGICVFALSSKAKTRLDEQIKSQDFLLRHIAVCVGTPKYKNKILYIEQTNQTEIDMSPQFLHRNKKTNLLEFIPQLNVDAVAVYSNYKVLDTKEQISLTQIDGGFGFDDEVRFLLKDAKSPVFGDKLYGGDTLAKDTNLALFVVEVKFVHPITNKNVSFRYLFDYTKKPWSYFDVAKFLKV